jgi:hypothetical protein
MARLSFEAIPRALDANGDNSSGAKLYVFQAGTTTPVTTYSDLSLTTPHAFPVISDSAGLFPEIYVPTGAYKVRITDADDALISEADNVKNDDSVSIFDAITDAEKETIRNSLGVPYGVGAIYNTVALMSAETKVLDVGTIVTANGLAYIVDVSTATDSDVNGVANKYSRIYAELPYQSAEIEGTDSRSFILSPDYNRIGASPAMSFVSGGSETQPNGLGKEIFVEQFTGDGTTTSFALTLPFVINTKTYINIKATVARFSDGLVYSTDDNLGGITVTDYGTSAPTVTLATAPAIDDTVEFRVYGENDDGVTTLQEVSGYDSVSSSIASIVKSHHSMNFPGSGHNVILGGSYHSTYGSYNGILGGSNNKIGFFDNASVGCFALGRSCYVDGTDSIAMGLNIKLRGNFSRASGRNHIIDNLDYCDVSGRGGSPVADGDVVIGAALSTDTEVGIKQKIEFVMSRDTTNATISTMQVMSGGTNHVWHDEMLGTLTVRVAALKDDGTKAASFAGTFQVYKNAGTCRVNGSTGDVTIPLVHDQGSSGYTVSVRGLGGNLTIRPTGAASENVRWVAHVSGALARWV